MKRYFSRAAAWAILLSLLPLQFLQAEHPEPPREGMWLPQLIYKLNEAEMQSMGLKLSAEDLYSVNKSSLKDAIVSFGGFCTGEVISPEGLLLTNHHCGFGQIQQHSSPENDLLTKGFWAMSREDELPNPGLTATFIVRIEDVTEKVLANVDPNASDADREAQIAKQIAQIESDAAANTHYEAKIKPFFYGAEFYMFITETYRDVRLVGAPPSAIGKFGGDTDNWMWPRHTGDFSMFRIYAGPDNKPADYSPDNKPYKPRHHFPISLKGIEKDDFTMVYGFPGRTQEYLPSYAIELTKEKSNPVKIQLREDALEIMEKGMRTSDKVRIQYAAKQARIANYWKKWRGENMGLERFDVIEKKRAEETEFVVWARQNVARKAKYGGLMDRFAAIYKQLEPLQLAVDYLNEAAFRAEILDLAYRAMPLVNEGASGEIAPATVEALKKRAAGHFKDYYAPIDQEIIAEMMEAYYNGTSGKYRPPVLDEIHAEYKGDWKKWAENLFEESVFADEARLIAFLDKTKSAKLAVKIESDPAYKLVSGVLGHWRSALAGEYFALTEEIESMMKTYVEGLREMQADRKFYPDANSTLRITYGKVDDYHPRDGVDYGYYTTLEGIMEKYIPGDGEFDLPEKLISLYEKKDFGRYTNDKGEVPVCFIASNHTTGGNSGSPVINGEGHLIGTNFDRNWEGTMSDLNYNPEICRNIAVDVRYTLFIIDKLAGAGHLVDEMTIIE